MIGRRGIRKMTKQEDTIKEVVAQGKELLHKANTRHVIIRKANGDKLVDVTFGIAGVFLLFMLWFQPFGLILGLAAVVYSLYSKFKLEIVRESSTGDNVIEMRLPDD